MSTSSGQREELAEIVGSYLRARDGDQAPPLEELLARHPDRAEQLEDLLRLEHDVQRFGPRRGTEVPLERVGEYVIVRELARGGMGVVFEARHTELERTVAIKMVKSERLSSPADLERFRREMRAVASLDHVGIVPIYEVGEHEGVPFFAMKYMSGGTLSRHLERIGGDPTRAAEIVRRLALAIQAAHERGILHRDLKPANVLVDAAGEACITDFGLAKRLDSEPGLTRTQATVGTPSYMAPEQVSSAHGRVGVGTDVYGLGAILYEILTRKPPFDAESSFEILRQVIEESPRPLRELSPTVPPDLETITMKCLEKEPARRYTSARELAQDLDRFLERRPVHARPISILERTWRWCRRNPYAVVVGSLLLVLAIGSWVGTLLVSIQRNRAVEAEVDAQEKLRASLLAQARALRLSGLAGRREESLAALQDAARIRPGLDVRNEVIASLGLLGLVEERTWSGQPAENSRSLALTPDFEIYARGNERGLVSVRTVEDDRELLRLEGPSGVRELCFGPEGRYLAASFVKDGLLLVWDWRSGEERFRTTGMVLTAALVFGAAPTFVVGTTDGEVRIVDLDTGETSGLIRIGATPEELAVCAATGDVLAVSGRRAFLLETASGRVRLTLPLSGRASCVCWSPDGGEIAVGGSDGVIRRWNSSTGEELAPLEGHELSVSHVAYTNGGETLTSLSWDDTLRVWDRRNAREVLRKELLGRQDPAWSFDAAGERMGILRDELVVLLRFEAPVFPRPLPRTGASLLNSPRFLANGNLVAAGGEDGLRIWELAGDRRPEFLPMSRLLTVIEHAPTACLLTSSESGLQRWPMSMDRGELALGPPEHVLDSPLRERAFGSADALEDAPTLLVRTAERGRGTEALLIDLVEERVRHLPHPLVVSVALHPSGRWAATATWNGFDVLIWDLQNDPPTFEVLIAGRSNGIVRFSPLGTWLLTNTTSHGFQVWTPASWELAYENPSLPFAAMALRRDETLLAVCGRGVIHLIDPQGWEELARLEAPESVLTDLFFSEDGRWLAATGSTVHLWDLARLRTELGSMGLDWDAPPLPDSLDPVAEVRVAIDLGELADPTRWSARVPERFLGEQLELLDARLRSDPGDVGSLQRRVAVFERMGRHRDAARDLDRLIALSGDDAQHWLHRANALMAARLWGRAAAEYGRVLAQNPKDTFARRRRAMNYERLGRFPEAIDDLEGVLRERPRDPFSLNLLAWLLVVVPPEQRDLERAAELSGLALAADPTGAHVLNTRGAVLVRLGRFAEAIEHLEDARARRPQPQVEDELFLVLAYFGAGLPAEAAASYDRMQAIQDGVTVEDALGIAPLVGEVRTLLADPDALRRGR